MGVAELEGQLLVSLIFLVELVHGIAFDFIAGCPLKSYKNVQMFLNTDFTSATSLSSFVILALAASKARRVSLCSATDRAKLSVLACKAAVSSLIRVVLMSLDKMR